MTEMFLGSSGGLSHLAVLIESGSQHVPTRSSSPGVHTGTIDSDPLAKPHSSKLCRSSSFQNRWWWCNTSWNQILGLAFCFGRHLLDRQAWTKLSQTAAIGRGGTAFPAAFGAPFGALRYPEVV